MYSNEKEYGRERLPGNFFCRDCSPKIQAIFYWLRAFSFSCGAENVSILIGPFNEIPDGCSFKSSILEKLMVPLTDCAPAERICSCELPECGIVGMIWLDPSNSFRS